MRFVGLMGVIFGVMLILGGVASCVAGPKGSGGPGPFIQGIFILVVGLWTRSAAGAFQRIVDTEGNDIANLMNAIGELRRIYGLQRVLFLVAMVLFVLGVMLGILFLTRAG
jgi:hypothetical protein